MAKNFFDIQRSETRKIKLIAAAIFFIYVGALFVPIYFLVRLFTIDASQSVALRALAYATAFGATILAFQLWFADRHGIRIILEGLSAHEPDAEDHYHQRLARLAEEVGVAAGGARPRLVVIPTLSTNAFALADSRQSVIGVTEGIVSHLSREQTQAVVAHELAHIVNRDCRLATWVCCMTAPFIALADTLEQMEDESRDAKGDGLELLVRGLVMLMTVVLSRKRELRADATAVQLTRNPLALAEALHRIAEADHFIGGPAGSLSPIFVVPSRYHSIDFIENAMAELFSSHPPIAGRIRMLAEMSHVRPEAVAESAGARPYASPADSLDNVAMESQHWMLRAGEAWLGPFLLAELVAQPAFGPQAWVRRAEKGGAESDGSDGGNDQGVPVFSDPLINKFSHRSRKGIPTTGPCPRCQTPLERMIYEGVPVGRCPQCGGVLVSEPRVARLLKRREVVFSEEFLREADEWLKRNSISSAPIKSLAPADPGTPCRCPLCNRMMTRRNYSYQFFIPIDSCYECRQIWFDAKELELLQALIERRPLAVAPADSR